MSTWSIKKGDRAPAYAAQLKVNGEVLSLVGGGLTVRFYMRPKGGGALVVDGGTATITNAAEGRVEYAWEDGDTDTVGTFEAEFRVTASGVTRTIPSRGFNYIEVVEGVNP